MKKLLREILLLLFVFIPLGLLYTRWASIPDTIPVHYGLSGKADRFDSKEMLLWLLPSVLVLMYSVLALVPFIDPKKRITNAQGSFYSVRLAVMMFISIVFISYLLSLTSDWNFSKSIPLLMMAFITVVGNYLPVIKPNYFIGIRTPWTLENEQVWTLTHRFSGRLWVVIGVSGFIVHLIWSTLPLTIYIGVIILLVIISVVYSYKVHQHHSIKQV